MLRARPEYFVASILRLPEHFVVKTHQLMKRWARRLAQIHRDERLLEHFIRARIGRLLPIGAGVALYGAASRHRASSRRFRSGCCPTCASAGAAKSSSSTGVISSTAKIIGASDRRTQSIPQRRIIRKLSTPASVLPFSSTGIPACAPSQNAAQSALDMQDQRTRSFASSFRIASQLATCGTGRNACATKHHGTIPRCLAPARHRSFRCCRSYRWPPAAQLMFPFAFAVRQIQKRAKARYITQRVLPLPRFASRRT